MKKIKSRDEWMSSVNENEELDIAIKLEDGHEEVVKSLKGVEDVEVKSVPNYGGIIKAKALRKRLMAIKKLPGVEGVEIETDEKE